jgi:hypothetical protein
MLSRLAEGCALLGISLLTGLAILNSSASAQVETPAPGTPLRKAILDSLRPMVAAEVGAPVEFASVDMRVLGEWTFVTAVPQRPGGGEIEYLYTRYQSAWEQDMFGGTVAALLRETPNGWLVYEYDLGATDVIWLDWKDWYPVPPEVFP